jgi:hypothetical protein
MMPPLTMNGAAYNSERFAPSRDSPPLLPINATNFLTISFTKGFSIQWTMWIGWTIRDRQ